MLAFIGGTGPEGIGLAIRFAIAGHELIIGSRSVERAEEAAAKVREKATAALVSGLLNEDAAAKGDIVINTVPYSAQADLLPGLRQMIADKLVISTVVPLQFEKGVSAIVVPEGSAAQQAQALLPEATVVGALQTLSAINLNDPSHPMESDVLVTGDDAEARKRVIELVEQIEGLRGVDAGRLANSQYVEHITALLIGINRRYKAHAEFKVVGLPGD
ncbi:MAG: NADPH-dependent F420 reductase [Dehalococcoidia bacterium]